MILGRIAKLGVFLLSLLGLSNAYAGQSLSIQGRLTNSSGQAVIGTAVQFRVQILTPNASRCILYDETQTLDLSQTGGLFAINLNDGTGTQTPILPTTFTLEQAVSNRLSFSVNSAYCASGSGTVVYSPAFDANRKVILQFKDPSSMYSFETIPEMDLNPIAYAMDSVRIGGYTASSLLRVVDGTTPGNPAPFSSAQFTELQNLIGGISTNYMSTTSGSTTGAQLPLASGDPASPNTGSIWFDTTGSGALKYKDASGTIQTVGTAAGGGGTITAVTAGTGLDGGGSSGSVSLSLEAVSPTSAGSYGSATKVPVLTVDAYGRVTAASEATISGVLPAGNNGEFLKSDGSTWAGAVLEMADLKNGTGGPLFPAFSCPNGHTFYFDSISGEMRCKDFGPLNIVDTSGTSFTATRYGSAAGSSVSLRSAGGSSTTPTYSSAADVLGSLRFGGYLRNAGDTADAFTSLGSVGAEVESLDGQNRGSGAVTFATASASGSLSEKMRITSAGNVGIGSTNPGYKLDVNGSLSATSLYLNGVAFDPNSSSTTVPATGGSSNTITQGGTNAATANRSALTLRNNGTGGSFEYNLLGLDGSGAVTSSIRQDGGASFTSLNTSGALSTADKLIAPYIYGSQVASGSLTLDSTTHATKGNVILAPSGGNVGIGTDNPQATMHLFSTADPNQFLLDSVGAVASNVSGRRANGTTASRTAVNAGDNLLIVRALGYDGTAYSSYPSAAIFMRASETWTSSSHAGYLTFHTTPTGSVAHGTERMRITSDGRVGIGTASPQGALDVMTSGGRQIAARANSPYAWADLSSSSGGYALFGNNAYVGAGNTFNYANTHGSIGANGVALSYPSWGDVSFFGATGATTADTAFTPSVKMVIKSSGNVGIGTTTPGATLDIVKVSSTAPASFVAQIRQSATNGALTDSNALLQFSHANGTNSRLWQIGTGSNTLFGHPDNFGIVDLNATASPFTIERGTGNVGIGTASPLSKLDVRGWGASSKTWTSAAKASYSAAIFGGSEGALQVVGDDQGSHSSSFILSSGDTKHWLVSHRGPAQNNRLYFNYQADVSTNASMDGMGSLLTLDTSGKVGIGTTNPTASLELKAGTATASNAPLKFTAGTNLTTPENGAMEYDGTNYYLTVGTTRYAIPLAGAAASHTTVSAGAGAAGTPSYTFSGDPNTGFFSSAAESIGVAANGAKVFDFSSAGLVSPTPGGAALTSANGTSAAPTYSFAGDNDTGWFSPAANTLAAATSGIERVRVDASGNVGIATSDPTYGLPYNASSRILGVSGSGADNANSYGGITIGNNRATATSGDILGLIDAIAGSGAGAQKTGTRILSQSEGSGGANGLGARLTVLTKADNGSLFERMRIDSSGNVGIGTTNPGTKLEVQGAHGNTALASVTGTGTASALTMGVRYGATDNAWINGSGSLVFNPGGSNVGIGTTSPGGPLDIYSASPSNGIIRLNAPAGQYRFTRYMSAGSTRWDVGVNSVAESGTNAGADFFWNRFDDAGSYLDTPLSISRNSGNVAVKTLTSAGNIGVGTTAPLGRLDVQHSAHGLPATSGTVDAAIISRIGAAPAGTNVTIDMGVQGGTGDAWIQSRSRADFALNYKLLLNPNGGNVGVGTTNPNYKLEVIGDIRASGNLIANATTYSSDVRWKRDIEPLRGSLERLSRLKGVSYYWRQSEFPEMNFNNQRQIGLIAQDVEAEFPELVLTNEAGYKSVNYPALIAPIIQALQELVQKAIGTEGRVAYLEVENLRLRANEAVKDRKIAEAEMQAAKALRQAVKARSEVANLRAAVCEINPKAKVCAHR